MKIFTELEEKNLNLIEDGQEAEQQLEAKKHEFKELESEMQREIKVLTKGLQEADERKARIQKESKFMQGSAMDEENKKIEPQ